MFYTPKSASGTHPREGTLALPPSDGHLPAGEEVHGSGPMAQPLSGFSEV